MKPWNPDELRDSDIETDDGWRLLSKEEMAFMMPKDAEYFDCGTWQCSSHAGRPMEARYFSAREFYAYRTRAPLPPQFSGDDILGDLAKLLG